MAGANKSLFESEKQHMKNVYRHFDKMKKEADRTVKRGKDSVSSGAFEDQDAWIFHGNLSKAEKEKHKVESLVQSLYDKPYFAHMEASTEEGNIEHYYLSNNQSLNETISINTSSFLLPFKNDFEKPISQAIRDGYYDRNGKPIRYLGAVDHGVSYYFTIQPSLICNDEISKEVLLDVALLFSSGPEKVIDADELLAQILDENRDNPRLGNIIATLQKQQFDIIAADVNKDFVVQGCAGSGKSQCLFHRLFYLRDELGKNNWERVVLITPTTLFRDYSADLVKKYKLGDVENCSISDLYCDLLYRFDRRFRNRQYRIQLSEEYLPDQYLNEIYSDNVVSTIDTEIVNAIHKYTNAACMALGMEPPATIDIEVIKSIIKQLEEAIARHNLTDTKLADDAEYQTQKAERESIIAEIRNAERELLDIDKKKEHLDTEINTLSKLLAQRDEVYREREEWVQQRKNRIATARDALNDSIKNVDESGSISATLQYADDVYRIKDLTSGKSFESDEEYLRMLYEYCAIAETELKEYAKKYKPETLLNKNQGKLNECVMHRNNLVAKISDLNEKLVLCETWIREKTEEFEGEKNQRTLNLAEMEKAKYYLERIETTVFEQEVWNVLGDIKRKYDIKTLEIEQIDETHRKETKILYKSDLLFYLKLYAELYRHNTNMPNFRTFCIDEGQDLHKADYSILKKLFPRAVFNIFGDLAQVLHTNCGVHDWKKDTGISTIYSINKNYRNTAATVDFCNRRFKSNMESIGKIKVEHIPKELTTENQLSAALKVPGITVIVKDKECFDEFISLIGVGKQCDYIDTNTDKPDANHIACYSVFAAKGLEFSNVVVFAKKMTVNQKIVSCTRAMKGLYYYE